MDLNCYRHIDRKIKEDAAIFCYEMFNFLADRRSCTSLHPVIIKPFQGSEFSEEVGKAVLVIWRECVEDFRKSISNDFPKFLDNVENFERYFMFRAKEIAHSPDMHFPENILRVTAFLLELSYCCFEMKQGSFVADCVVLWWKMFLDIFQERFKNADQWRVLRQECTARSKIYDGRRVEIEIEVEEVEEHFDGALVKLNSRYLTPMDSTSEHSAPFCYKIITRYPTVDENTGMIVRRPAGPKPITRQDTVRSINHELENHGAVKMLIRSERNFAERQIAETMCLYIKCIQGTYRERVHKRRAARSQRIRARMQKMNLLCGQLTEYHRLSTNAVNNEKPTNKMENLGSTQGVDGADKKGNEQSSKQQEHCLDSKEDEICNKMEKLASTQDSETKSDRDHKPEEHETEVDEEECTEMGKKSTQGEGNKGYKKKKGKSRKKHK